MRQKTVIFALTVVAIATSVAGQPVTQDVDVAAYSQDAFQLTPSAPSVSRPVAIDATSAFSIRLWAASRTLTVSIKGPDGLQFTVGDPATSQGETAFMPIDSTPAGAAYLITVNNPMAGTWTLNVSESATLTAPLDVVAITMLNNRRWLVLAGGGQDYPAGSDIRLAVVAFDDTARVNNLTINARAFRVDDPSFAPVTIAFRDDGLGADERAGDGIFEGFFNPGAPGTYQVQVDATGSTPPATSFRRTAAATLRVVPRNANITGFTDRGVDDNGDGLFERIGVRPTANIVEAGTYLVYVALRASNGMTVHHTVTQALSAGPSTAEVFFGAEEIKKEFGVNGPYAVTEVRFLEEKGDDFVPADIAYALGATSAYTINQLQHPKLQLNGHFEAIGDDWDGDGLFDTLDVVIGVDVTEDGWYSYSAVLQDQAGHEIEFQGDVVFMRRGSYDMWWYFDGKRLGKGNIDGPYRIVNVIVNGDFYGIIDYDGFTTPKFKASQFDGYQATGPLPTTITASAASGTYGGTATPLTATLKSNGAPVSTKTVAFSLNGSLVGTAVTDASGTATLIGVSLGGLAAATYPSGIFASFAGDATYAASNGSGALDIAKAVLTVKANDASRVYGDPNPAFGASYSGFVHGETLATSGVNGSPSLTAMATQTSAAGTYPIAASIGSLAATNYSFTFVAGTLTVTKAPLTVTANDAARVYSDPNPVFTASYSGFVNGETLATSGVSGAPDLTTTATQTSANGTYPITISIGSLASTNYSFTFVPGTLTVLLNGIVGIDSVFIGSTKAVADSFDSTFGYPASAGSNAIILSNGPIEVSGAKISGNVLSSQSSVLLGPNSQVSGNVSAGTTITNQGTARSLMPDHPLSPMVAAAVPDCEANAGDVNIAANSVLTLQNGTYCYHSMTLGGNATLQVSGAVVIKLTGVLNASGGAIVNSTTIPSNLRIVSSYTGADGVTLSGHANAYLTIYAPGTNITVTGGSPVFGALLGKTLTISGNSQVHYDTRSPGF